MDDRQDTFQYTYSARERAEVEQIRRRYLPPEEDKMEQLRRLDNSVTRKAQAASIAIGVIGALLLGFGMSLCMTELAALLGVDGMATGIPVGLAGLVLVAMAYPVFNRVLRKERERIAPEILRLTDELMK